MVRLETRKVADTVFGCMNMKPFYKRHWGNMAFDMLTKLDRLYQFHHDLMIFIHKV